MFYLDLLLIVPIVFWIVFINVIFTVACFYTIIRDMGDTSVAAIRGMCLIMSVILGDILLGQ